jgi:cytochrome P450
MLWLIMTLGLMTGIYFWSIKKFNYFKSKGVPQETGYFPLGSKNHWQLITAQLAFADLTREIYEKYSSELVVGYYSTMGAPVLLIKDLEIAKRILIKDFDHFVDRRAMLGDHEANKYWNNMVLNLKGDSWKAARTIVTPIFTSGRLKTMVPIMHSIAGQLNDHLSDLTQDDKPIDTKVLFGSFAFEVIMNTGFGVEVNAWKDPTNIVRKMVK